MKACRAVSEENIVQGDSDFSGSQLHIDKPICICEGRGETEKPGNCTFHAGRSLDVLYGLVTVIYSSGDHGFYKAAVKTYAREWIESGYESNRRNIHYAGVCALLELNIRIHGRALYLNQMAGKQTGRIVQQPDGKC